MLPRVSRVTSSPSFAACNADPNASSSRSPSTPPASPPSSPVPWDPIYPTPASTCSSTIPTPRRSSASPRCPFTSTPVRLPASIASRAGLARVLVLGWTIVLTAVALAVLAALALLRLDRRRAAFVAAVTHEMRTPLTTFRLYTDLLADGAVTDPADQQTYFRTLRAQSVRLASLVNNVLTFARLERRQRIALETTPVAALLERCLPHLQDRAALDEMSVAWTPGDAADHPVQAAPALVEQILFNLVDNACKYGQNEAHPTLDLTARADATHVHLTLRDHGPGLHESPRDLFKPFVRTAQRDADASPGVGLGLALSRRMARAMGGELCVASIDTGRGGRGFRLVPVENRFGLMPRPPRADSAHIAIPASVNPQPESPSEPADSRLHGDRLDCRGFFARSLHSSGFFTDSGYAAFREPRRRLHRVQAILQVPPRHGRQIRPLQVRRPSFWRGPE